MSYNSHEQVQFNLTDMLGRLSPTTELTNDDVAVLADKASGFYGSPTPQELREAAKRLNQKAMLGQDVFAHRERVASLRRHANLLREAIPSGQDPNVHLGVIFKVRELLGYPTPDATVQSEWAYSSPGMME